MKHFQKNPNERGSAILLVLGLLSLLLLLALVFAVTSRNAQIVSEANTDQTTAALYAKSAVSSAIQSLFFFQNKGNLLKNSTLEDYLPNNNGFLDQGEDSREYFYGSAGSSDTDDFFGLQPYVGYVGANTNWKGLCIYGEVSENEAESDPFMIDTEPYQSIYYTHEDDTYDECSEDTPLPGETVQKTSLYEIFAATPLGEHYVENSAIETLLNTAGDKQLQFKTVIGEDGSIVGRYGFVAFSEGSKFDLNRIVASKLVGDTDEPYVPFVGNGKVLQGDPGNEVYFYDPGNEYDSAYAVMGYEYDADNRVEKLLDGGKLEEDKTVQYGLHPQELRTKPAYYDDAALYRKSEEVPPRWFTYDQLLEDANAKNAFKGDLFTFCLSSGTEDREYRFNGTGVSAAGEHSLEEMEETIDGIETSPDDNKWNGAFRALKANISYPWGIYEKGPATGCLVGPTWNEIGKACTMLSATGDGANEVKAKAEHFFSEHIGLDCTDPIFKGTTGTDTDLTPQVFANLVDFSDEDNDLTYAAAAPNGNRLTFSTPSMAATQPLNLGELPTIPEPKYCGNERVPAVIGVSVTFDQVESNVNIVNDANGYYCSGTVAGGFITYKPTVTLTLQNPFNTDLSTTQKYRVIVEGEIAPIFLAKQVWVFDGLFSQIPNYRAAMRIGNGGIFDPSTLPPVVPIPELIDMNTGYGLGGAESEKEERTGIVPRTKLNITTGLPEETEVIKNLDANGWSFRMDKEMDAADAWDAGPLEAKTIDVVGEIRIPIVGRTDGTTDPVGDHYYYTGTGYAVKIKKIIVMANDNTNSSSASTLSELVYTGYNPIHIDDPTNPEKNEWHVAVRQDFPDATPTPGIFFNYVNPINNLTRVIWNGASCKEPRMNHNPIAWEWFGDRTNPNFDEEDEKFYNDAENKPNPNDGGTIGVADSDKRKDQALVHAWKVLENSLKNDNPGSDRDWEPEFKPRTGAQLEEVLDGDGSGSGTMYSTLSTYFIPNNPITSLWQLGAIHRGEIGRTINLKKFCEFDVNGMTHLYRDGDAWILDYLKISSLDAYNGIRGKFNPNCFNAGAYRYLFANIPANEDANDTMIYANGYPSVTVNRNSYYNIFIEPGYTGATFNLEANVFKFKDFHGDHGKTAARAQSWSPVQAFFNFVDINGGGGGKLKCNDRVAESLIGCTAGLLSTRYETYTVVAVGQKLQFIARADELPPSDTDVYKNFSKQLVNPKNINGNIYSILGTQVRLVTLVRDCWFGNIKVVKTQNLKF